MHYSHLDDNLSQQQKIWSIVRTKFFNTYFNVSLNPCNELLIVVFNVISMHQEVNSDVSSACWNKSQKIPTTIEGGRTCIPVYICMDNNVRQFSYHASFSPFFDIISLCAHLAHLSLLFVGIMHIVPRWRDHLIAYSVICMYQASMPQLIGVTAVFSVLRVRYWDTPDK